MIRGNAVEVAKLFQARCKVDGCYWFGELAGSYQKANDERQEHLAGHREQEAGQ